MTGNRVLRPLRCILGIICGGLLLAGFAPDLALSKTCPPCPTPGCAESGTLRVYYPDAGVALTPEGLFAVRACTGRTEKATVVLRRAKGTAVLSSRTVRLQSAYVRIILLRAPGRRTGTYRVTVGLGGTHVSVLVKVTRAVT